MKIGDVIKDTVGYGDVEILDIYQSVTHSDKQAFLIQVRDDSNFQTMAMPEELQKMFPTNEAQS